MSSYRFVIICLALIIAAPGVARGASATCDEAFSCIASDCGEEDILTGIKLGAVEGIGALLCFVEDAKCPCFQQITSKNGGPTADEWELEVDDILNACEGSPSGGRSLSGIAFEAASTVCTPTFADDVLPVLDAACGDCHLRGNSGDFVFSNGISDLVNAPSGQSNLDYITPGDPSGSYLLLKIQGTQGDAGGGGSRMPLGGMLAARDVSLIKAWIEGGALP
ncbi:MAG: hypothetical protein P8R42_05750 [Candidatus Binatia bacterium]|nr:hypothetical protein [Candidatus Binatia bacterium]